MTIHILLKFVQYTCTLIEASYFVPVRQGLPASLRKTLGRHVHTSALATSEFLLLLEHLAHRVAWDVPMRSSCLCSTINIHVITVYDNVIMHTLKIHSHTVSACILLTYRLRDLESQQFLTVLIKWGGSEKKKNERFSSVNGFSTLYTQSDIGSWSLIRRLFTEFPSKVAPRT